MRRSLACYYYCALLSQQVVIRSSSSFVVSAFGSITTTTTHQTQTVSSSFSSILSSPRPFSTSLAMAADPKKKLQPFVTWSYDQPCTSMSWNELVPASVSVRPMAEAVTLESLTAADLVVVGMQAPPKPEPKEQEEEEEEEEEKDESTPTIEFTGILAELDTSIQGALTALLTDNHKEFQQGAKVGATTPTLRVQSQRFIALGLGREEKPGEEQGEAKESGADDTAAKKDPWEGAGWTLGKTVASKCHAEKKVKHCTVALPADLIYKNNNNNNKIKTAT